MNCLLKSSAHNFSTHLNNIPTFMPWDSWYKLKVRPIHNSSLELWFLFGSSHPSPYCRQWTVNVISDQKKWSQTPEKLYISCRLLTSQSRVRTTTTNLNFNKKSNFQSTWGCTCFLKQEFKNRKQWNFDISGPHTTWYNENFKLSKYGVLKLPIDTRNDSLGGWDQILIWLPGALFRRPLYHL